MSLFGKLKPGNYTNRKGKHYKVSGNGQIENIETLAEFVDHPNVKRQLDGFQRIYMQQTLKALYEGEEPPNSVGGYGVLTKKKLKSVWDDNWQAELDKMSEYYDVTYDSFFDVQPKEHHNIYNATSMLEDYFFADPAQTKEHPPAGTFLTANEIVEQYGSEEENEKS